MSSPTKKNYRPGVTSRRSSVNPPSSPGSASRSPSRVSMQSSNSVSSGKGLSRTKTKAGPRGPLTGTEPGSRKADTNSASTKSSAWLDDSDDDAKQERLALLELLKERLTKAESASEEYQKQVEVLRMKLDEALGEQSKLEYRIHEEEESVEKIIVENKETLRQRRELENQYKSERKATMSFKEDFHAREEELLAVINRLKTSLAEEKARAAIGLNGEVVKDSFDSPIGNEKNCISRESAGDSDSAPESSVEKDKIIQSLQLELAEAQIKLVEVENIGGGRLQELEKMLMEARMANARLIEGNESFQLLLNEKSINGDLAKDDLSHCSTVQEEYTASALGSGTSLAEELEHASDKNEQNHHSPDAEIKSLKDQNKALSLYISKIIERLLNHKDFESILDKTPDLMSGPKLNTEKDLPPPPPRRETMSVNMLSRAKSVTTAPTRTRPRPMSYMPVRPSTDLPFRGPGIGSANRRSLQRSSSVRSSAMLSNGQTIPDFDEQSSALTDTQNDVNITSHNQTSPTYISPRSSIVNTEPKFPNMAARLPSGSGSVNGSTTDAKTMSTSANNADTDNNLENRFGGGAASPPRISAERGAAVMAGNKPKPLRLVQESAEAQAEQEARKKANRGSWMPGWFSKAMIEPEAQQKRTFSG